MRSCVYFVAALSVFSANAFAGAAKKDDAKKSASAPAKFTKGVLTDSKGMTLYTFDKDVANSGKSVCNEGCIAAWPALKADANAKDSGDFNVISRDDGSKQWAHKGKPLYYWVKDKKAGEKTGDKFNGVWHIVSEK